MCSTLDIPVYLLSYFRDNRSGLTSLGAVLLLTLLITPIVRPARSAQSADKLVVSFVPGHPSNSFVPSHTIGAALDGHEKGEVLRMLSRANIKEMLSAGLKPLTYRLRTELQGEAWHWNPRGKWSDPLHRRGYWTSNDFSSTPVNLSYGYRLPRRGNTTDQANDNGYSRLDDGDPRTFWKSNPYLDKHFTGEENSLHPQWATIDLGHEVELNAIRILWGTPFATKYKVQYSGNIGSGEFLPRLNAWQSFPQSAIEVGKGGSVLLKLSGVPVKARFVRVLMSENSSTEFEGSGDVRDRVGYAIRELYVGTLARNGKLQDLIEHGASHDNQTLMYVSSTDPWHRATDIDKRIEQPGFDYVFRSGLTNGQPMLTPVGVLYDTPENAAAEIRFLASRKYPIQRVEIGEEPDGQFVEPEDYAELYLQWATALHRVDPKLQFGGPGFENLDPDDPDNPGLLTHPRWTRRFINVLRNRNRMSDFNFFSFEWYPFDDVCLDIPSQLASHVKKFSAGLDEIKGVLPKGMPLQLTELGYSAFGGEVEVRIEGALLNADAVGVFLTHGGDKAYLYGYEPNELIEENSCDSKGNNMLFGLGENGRVAYKTATYYGARMMTELWAQPGDQQVEIYSVHSSVRNRDGNELVTAYAIRTGSGKWSLMALNLDPKEAHSLSIQFEGSGTPVFKGPVDQYQYSSEQYVWHSKKDDGYPVKSLPPKHTLVPNGTSEFAFPPYSITVLRDAK